MENTIHVLDAIRNLGGKEPSLKAFALALEVSPTRVYAIARKPIPGAVYDPDAANWDALSTFFAGKLVADDQEGYHSMEDLVTAAIEKDEWLKENDGRRAGAVSGSNLIEVDGEKIPMRKAAIFEMGSEKESLVCFKKDVNVYKMVYQTASFTVLRPVAEDGSFAKSELKVVSNLTLNTKCVVPCDMERAIKERFSGEYAAKLEAQAAAKADAEAAEQTEM